MNDIDGLIKRLRELGSIYASSPSRLCLEIQAADALADLQSELAAVRQELERKRSSLATATNALSYAESQASEWRCKAGTLENELRRAELDKVELRQELEEARKKIAGLETYQRSLLQRLSVHAPYDDSSGRASHDMR